MVAFSETFGTMLLVFFGIGSVVTATGGATYVHHKGKEDETRFLILGWGSQGQPLSTDALHVAAAFGIAVTSIATAIGHISGAHLNPALSIGLAAAGRIDFVKAIAYSFAQTAAATIGAGLLEFVTLRVVTLKNGEYSPGSGYNPDKDFQGWHLGASLLGAGVGFFQGILIEAILTFILVLVVCVSTDPNRKMTEGLAPLLIGLTVFLCHVTGIQLTGSSVNPARSIGPAFFTPEDDVWSDLLVYLIGPVLGGWIAGSFYA